jgi:thiosulfate/3-mercaptopyruvate sulfurtransferase
LIRNYNAYRESIMENSKSAFIVDADWVQARLGTIKIVDGSWYLPAQNRNGAAEYASGHIPGAVFFDQDVIADHSTGLPHSIPSPEFFAAEVGKLGICETDTIVVYDGPGIFTAPRVWWLLRLMGARDVYVMDGGIDGWKAEGRPLETDLPEPEPATFKTDFRSERVTTFEAMKQIVAGHSVQIADARGAGRFTGEEAEPRAGMRSGHMPSARNMPSGSFSTAGKFKDLSELKDLFKTSGIDLDKPVVTTCGSGVTAAIISLALASLGHSDNTLYDGSWSEWGGRADTPVVTGRE